jgi:SnoaL-like domain
MGTWTRAELQEAHDAFIEAAAEAGRTGDWSIWADRFTEDAEYHEHLYGKFHGRAEISGWIAKTMGEWPMTEMTQFPHNWCVCDEARGWWICEIENRFDDPGDGKTYEASNITILKYAGDGLFSSEEDVYNPATFAPMVKEWMAAKAAHSPDPG